MSERPRPRRRKKPKGQDEQAVLIVEYRDAVFNRLAANFRLAGMRVIRARCGFEAMIQYTMFRPRLVVASVDTRGQSGWLLTAKLRLVEPAPHVWLYKPRVAATDVAMAHFLRAEELLEYGRDFQKLSDAVFGRLAGELPAADTPHEPWCTTVSRAV